MEIQQYLKEMVESRDFNKDILREYILFSEEWGELAKELRKVWETQDKLVKHGLSDEEAKRKALEEHKHTISCEMADCLLYLINLGNLLNLDVEKAMIEKETINAKRKW